jgi:hypothetical protein
MRRWNPQPSIARWIAIGLLVLALAASAIPFLRLLAIFRGPPEGWLIDLRVFGWVVALAGLLLLAAGLGYRAAAAFTLAYELDRNGLYITWLGNRAVIPLDQITSLDVGVTPVENTWQFLQMIAYYRGPASSIAGQPLQIFSTQPLAQALVVHTPATSYVISPADPDSFVQDLEQRRNLGSTKPLSTAVEPGRMFFYAFWSDPTIRRLLLITLLVNLLALAIVTQRYPHLAPTLDMRFDPTGQVAEVRPRHQVLFLPLAALGLTLVNLVLGIALYSRQQLSVRLLQGASLIVQMLFLIALLRITR